MEKYYSFNKGIFDSNYQIYEGTQIKCTMFFDTWRTESKAITQNKSYLFKDNGIFSSTTQIFGEKSELLGSITYNDWKTKATITLISGENYACDFVNMWHSKWTITDYANKQIDYDSSAGIARTNNEDELMLLLGFYVKEHFTKMLLLIIFIAVLFPIFTRGIF